MRNEYLSLGPLSRALAATVWAELKEAGPQGLPVGPGDGCRLRARHSLRDVHKALDLLARLGFARLLPDRNAGVRAFAAVPDDLPGGSLDSLDAVSVLPLLAERLR